MKRNMKKAWTALCVTCVAVVALMSLAHGFEPVEQCQSKLVRWGGEDLLVSLCPHERLQNELLVYSPDKRAVLFSSLRYLKARGCGYDGDADGAFMAIRRLGKVTVGRKGPVLTLLLHHKWQNQHPGPIYEETVRASLYRDNGGFHIRFPAKHKDFCQR